MSGTKLDLSALASLAHRALNNGDSEYARNKALISQFFRPSCVIEQKEATRLALIDSLYSTNVNAKRLFGISDIAGQLREAFPNDAEIKERAAEWIADDFDSKNPLYKLFAAKHGVTKSGEEGKASVSLLSKYMYFATEYRFPIYDKLGADYHYLAGKRRVPDFQKRFHTLREISREYAVDSFDRLDNFFWLFGKVSAGSFSLVLNQERYRQLARYKREKPVSDVITEIRGGVNADALLEIFGNDLYAFIQQTDFTQE